jgi:hypothetical protein
MSEDIPPATDGSQAILSFYEDFFPCLLDIQEAWDLTDANTQELSRISKSTFSRWKSNPDKAQWDKDQIERLSYLFSIHRILTHILSESDSIRYWLRQEQGDAVFGGASPLSRMLCGQVGDLYEVNRWLQARLDLIV